MNFLSSLRSVVRAAVSGILLAGGSLLPVNALAVDRFVATNGQDNTNSGRGLSVGSPYLTIDYAASQAGAGDTIYIRAGSYRETLTPNVSGTANAPIVFKPYNNEAVIVSGLDLITPGSNGAGTWAPDTGSVYKIQLTANYGSDSNYSQDRVAGCQVFVDGQGMAQARWPNAPTPMGIRRTEAATATTGSYTATGAAGSLIYNALYRNAGLDAFATDAWKNGLIVFAPGSEWYRRAAYIDGNTPAGANSEVRFTFNPYNEASNREDTDIGDPFFLMGRRIALDAEREYFFDTLGATATEGRDGPRYMLYLRLPGSVSPTGRVIEMQRRKYAINLSNVSYLQFENLRIVGARIRTASTTDHCVFRGLKVEYPSYTWHEELGDTSAGIYIEGTGHQIVDSEVRYSTHQGILFVSGSDHLVKNTVISDCFGPAIEMQNAASNVRAENVTVYDQSGTGISAAARPNQVLYCDIYNTALFTTDCGALNAIGDFDGLNSEWGYNWAHDAQGSVNSTRDWYGSPAIRLDSGPTNFLIHHNLAWNTTQPEKTIAIWAITSGQTNYQNAQIRLYNNSVDQQIGFIETTNNPASIKGVEMSNNLTGVGMNITSSSTDAQGKLYLTDVAIRNNVFPNLSIPNNPAPPHSANRTGATGWTSAGTPPLGYRLGSSSQAINNGTTIPGITDGFVGAAPDIGALEAGLPQFVPGAKVRAQDLAGLVVTPSVIGNTVKFVVTGLPAGRSLPDAFRLKIGTAAASNDLTQSFDFVNHSVTATFNALSAPGSGQTVQVSLDGTTFTTLSTAITVPASTLAATTTGLASSANPILPGNAVTFTAAVAAGSGTPAGTVTFLDGTTTLGTGSLNGSSVATFTTSSLVLGVHSITASFPANASQAASTSAILLQNIREDATPPGTVRARFSDGNGASTAQQYPGAAGDGWLAGWTSLIGSASVVATTPLTAGNGNYLQVTRASGSGASSQAGVYRPWNTASRPDNRFSRLSFDFRIDSAAPPTTGATFDNASDCYNIFLTNAAVTAPSATTTTIFLRCFGASPGNDANGNLIRAQEWCVFNGTPGVSDGYAVNKFVRTNMIAVPGRAYTFTFDIFAADAAGTTSGGTGGVKTNGTFDVTITDRSDNTSVTVPGCGFRSASYASGGYLAFSTQQVTTTDNLGFSVDSIEMTGLPTSLALSSSGSPSAAGAGVTLTATATSLAGKPAGTVSFFDGAVLLGTAPLNPAGTATFTISTLASGTHSITASLAASESYAAANSTALTQMVQPPTPLQTWRAQYFTSAQLSDPALETSLWGENADPDRDGLNNLLERALGGHPLQSSAADIPQVGLDGSGYLTLTFKRAASDLTYLVQGTSNLGDSQSWITVATNPGTVGQTVVVHDSVLPGPGQRFLRLRVNP